MRLEVRNTVPRISSVSLGWLMITVRRTVTEVIESLCFRCICTYIYSGYMGVKFIYILRPYPSNPNSQQYEQKPESLNFAAKLHRLDCKIMPICCGMRMYTQRGKGRMIYRIDYTNVAY
ncbi:hypothetical protein BDW60DRAFT_102532 [Aspergillus nidulans var. acristatus]